MTTLTFTVLSALPMYEDLPNDFHVNARVTEIAYYRHTCLILFYVFGEEDNLEEDYGVLREFIIPIVEEFVLEDICTSIIMMRIK